MIFNPTTLAGVFLLTMEKQNDERGYFARTFCVEEFAEKRILFNIQQTSISFNHHKHTLRGLHFQHAPYGESKIVRCNAGAIYDVVLDVRPLSPTRYKHFCAELTPDNGSLLYIPAGLAHGFLTLTDNTEVSYFMSEFYHPAAAGGVRYNDPFFNIPWPAEPAVINDRDRHFPDWAKEDGHK